MKTLTEHISEKLIINKNYKSPGINNTIYDVFKKDFQWLSYNNMWYNSKDADGISISSFNSSVRKKLNDAIKPCIPNDGKMLTHYVWIDRAKNMFYDMLDLLNKKHDDIDFLCDDTETIYTNSTSRCKVIIKVFETDEHVIGLVGPENKSDSSSSNTLIVFVNK